MGHSPLERSLVISTHSSPPAAAHLTPVAGVDRQQVQRTKRALDQLKNMRDNISLNALFVASRSNDHVIPQSSVATLMLSGIPMTVVGVGSEKRATLDSEAMIVCDIYLLRNGGEIIVRD